MLLAGARVPVVVDGRPRCPGSGRKLPVSERVSAGLPKVGAVVSTLTIVEMLTVLPTLSMPVSV